MMQPVAITERLDDEVESLDCGWSSIPRSGTPRRHWRGRRIARPFQSARPCGRLRRRALVADLEKHLACLARSASSASDCGNGAGEPNAAGRFALVAAVSVHVVDRLELGNEGVPIRAASISASVHRYYLPSSPSVSASMRAANASPLLMSRSNNATVSSTRERHKALRLNLPDAGYQYPAASHCR